MSPNSSYKRVPVVVAAVILAAVTLFSCSGNVDPLVVIAYPSADTLNAGNLVEFKIWTKSVEGTVRQVEVSSFNDEQGRKAEEILSVDRNEWNGAWETRTPAISVDTLKHVVSFKASDTLGNEAEWDCTLILCRPKEQSQ